MSWRDSLTIFSTLIKFHTAHEKRSAIFTTLWSLRRDAYTMAWNALNLFRLIDCLWVTAPLFITVWTVVQTVLTATFNTYGDRQISTPPQKINTPEPIDKKFGTIDYVREGTSYTKFGRNPSTGGFWANGVNRNYFYLFIYTFFWSAYRSDPWMDFYAR